ncbi:MAG: hypothetical protein IID41_00230 [Planctomycetes bacterium]|nr:hypothetical protein [Planctomycetota bacterium]
MNTQNQIIAFNGFEPEPEMPGPTIAPVVRQLAVGGERRPEEAAKHGPAVP